eukprot:m.252129 g.252129  ORF g.252129 m.252129 type:complete len:169 (-) comp33902_c0_seq7:2076-2582(-)
MDRSKIFSNLDPTLEFQQNSRFAQKWHVDWTMYLREEWCTGTLLCETFSWMFPWCAKLLTLNESKEYARFAESNGCDDDGQELPIRWAAIEVLVDSTFSVQTDVWAFGVFVWEGESIVKITTAGCSCCCNVYNVTCTAWLLRHIYIVVVLCLLVLEIILQRTALRRYQ